MQTGVLHGTKIPAHFERVQAHSSPSGAQERKISRRQAASLLAVLRNKNQYLANFFDTLFQH